jgi:hypothetical protein
MPRMSASNDALRQRLDEIIATYKNETVGEQIRAIAQLSSEFSHRIHLIGEAVAGEQESFRFTCIQFALDLRGAREVEKIASVQPQGSPLYPGPEFLQYLILNDLEEVAAGSKSLGDLVIYLNAGAIKHAGIVVGEDLVISKWGLMHLWLHGTFEIPASYGSEVRFFKRPSRRECVESFLSFAHLNARGSESAT